MEYKVLIFGNGLNKEVQIGEATKLSIGTDKRCHIWLKGEIFPEDFLIKLNITPEGYRVELSEQIEIRQEMEELIPLSASVPIGYKGSEEILFSLLVATDFTNQSLDYHMAIELVELPVVTIGTEDNSDIRINNPEIPPIKLALNKQQEGYEAQVEKGVNYITHNGANIREDSFSLKNNEFFGVANIQFFYSNGRLYTEDREELICRLSTQVISEQNNKLKYPEFIRNVRLQFKQPEEKLEVLQPSNQPQEPEGSLIEKLLPMVIMMILMTVLRVMIRSNIMYALYFVVMMGMSSVMTAITFVRAKKRFKEKSIRREKVYNDYIEKKDQEIIDKRSDEKLIAQKMCILPQESIRQIQDFDARLFEKLKDHEDFLDVPIGTGTVDSSNQIKYKEQEYVESEDPLVTIPENIHNKYQKLSDMPIVLHLAQVNAVGVLGTRNKLYQMMKNIMISLASQHFYQDVKFFVMLNKEDVAYFSWMRWLRNINENGRRNILYDEGSKKTILEAIYNELSSREGMKKDEVRQLPHYIVFAYRSENMSGHPITKYVEKARDLGFTFIFFEEYKELMHEACDELVCLDRETYSGFIQKADDAVCMQQFNYQRIDKEQIAAAALKLACVHVNEISLESTLTKNITLYQLLKVMTAYDLNIGMRWANSNIYESMAAALGVDSSGQTVYLDIHEKAHGPHGLVAGTTGSGKSEILQSYVLSMCLNFHPYEVGFVIIDFKGGGMANQFKDLPHLNGAITNIDGKQIDRSLMSIKAELMKRQKLFAEYSVNKIDDYIELYKTGVAKIPLPHLILIVDEFAELKSDQPEFMKELISAARIGRSLGMHLILATQKPAGVVNDQIWSNSRFKLCLKVQDKSDSKEVLKSPLAAEIREPGRAYLQVGNNEIFQLFQSAYSGAPVNVEQMEQQKQFDINVVDFAGRRQPVYSQKPQKGSGDNKTQLDALVGYIEEYCKENAIEKLPDICLPPLAEVIPFPESIKESKFETDVIVPIGIYDNPSEQTQGVLEINLSKNNTFVAGSSLSGKTNLMQTIIKGLCGKYSAAEVCIYIMDFASMMLKNFEGLNQVGGVVTATDDNKCKQLIELLLNALDERKQILSELGLSSFSSYREAGYTELRQIVLIIENYSMLKTVFPEHEAAIGIICRDGVSVGISVILTNPQTSGLGMKMMTYFGENISLLQNDNTQYGMMFSHCRLYPDDNPGRGIVERDNTIREFQSYLAFSAEKEIEKVGKMREFVANTNNKNKGVTAIKIPTVPDIVTEEYFAKNYGAEIFENFSIPVGVRFDDIQPQVMKLTTDNFIGLMGDEKSNRLSFTKYMIDYLMKNSTKMPVELYIVDDLNRELEYAKTLPITKAYTVSQAEVEAIMATVFNEAKTRFAGLSKDGYSIDDKPLVMLIFNSALTEDMMSFGNNTMKMHELLVTKLRGCRVCTMHSNVPNTGVAFKVGSLSKLLAENCHIIAFEELKKIKFVNAPASMARTIARRMEKDDAFYIDNGMFTKIRTTNSNQS
ncbi:DNA segregation ATPase FtsK/SpoIIIE, S-DNA-T family [Pseudobutyrivibrio sp. YE44]|uniref:type VII secretion protein EssC n=1 Tax=Pseudobutyrivibrio sp. YE44 TaxID=1520802 RepID=UPI0008813077|nr:type VII secretion protein EssC [Pseudobutyrivibrio sp. YE44]SDB51907.1 DNA segregation ATPase FtsK/SpoIIIE, S-DNA-T family [Pseudobutyrivibrio sp. YE44]